MLDNSRLVFSNDSGQVCPDCGQPSKKKTAQLTATNQVLRIIKRSKKGVNATTLMAKTGFDLKKVRNIIQRTYKQGKIKRADKGIYIAV